MTWGKGSPVRLGCHITQVPLRHRRWPQLAWGQYGGACAILFSQAEKEVCKNNGESG